MLTLFWVPGRCIVGEGVGNKLQGHVISSPPKHHSYHFADDLAFRVLCSRINANNYGLMKYSVEKEILVYVGL